MVFEQSTIIRLASIANLREPRVFLELPEPFMLHILISLFSLVYISEEIGAFSRMLGYQRMSKDKL